MVKVCQCASWRLRAGQWHSREFGDYCADHAAAVLAMRESVL